MKKFVIALLILNIATIGYALRASRPPVLTMPLTQDQLTQLNVYLNDLWNMQNGRFELDIVTTSKSGAKNGEIWIKKTGATYYLEFKAGDAVRTSPAFTP